MAAFGPAVKSINLPSSFDR